MEALDENGEIKNESGKESSSNNIISNDSFNDSDSESYDIDVYKFRNFIFPAPKSSYKKPSDFGFGGKLMYFKYHNHTDDVRYIPSLLMRYDEDFKGSSKVLIYFHGNGEDIGHNERMFNELAELLRVHVIGVEYPGYGVYRDELPNESLVEQDALTVYEYLTEDFGIDENNILIFGRSIGSAPACYLAAKKNPGMLILNSPLMSIKDWLEGLLKENDDIKIFDIFRNIDHIENVTCPTFILHGKADTLIPYSHSNELKSKCKGITELRTPKKMTHNFFHFNNDLLKPLIIFLKNNEILVDPSEDFPEKYSKLQFPEELFENPKSYS